MNEMRNKIDVNYCDFDHATSREVRRLPVAGGGNVIVCFEHYIKEMDFRRERAETIGATHGTPAWESLKLYVGA